MDSIATAAYDALEQMLHDENEEPRPLPLSILESITDNFSAEMELGRGGFAVVYKGVLGSGMVAVKKLHETMDLDEKQLVKEIECLMKVRHKNIVRFLGYCADSRAFLTENSEGKAVIAEVRNRALCFEYVPKGSLDKHITDASCGLEWKLRYKIIKGICEGLHYLHKNHIRHFDLKPANILLDDNMVPKIADFCLARYLDQTQSTAIMGTQGYWAPEFLTGEITFKSDIYSLGVVIMEILTGERRFSTQKEVVESWRYRLERGQEDIPLEHVKACVDIGIICGNHIAMERPTTHRILEIFKDLGTNDFIASETRHAESSSSVPPPLSLAPYIRMPDGRNEHGSSKKNSSLVRTDGMYISQMKALERIIAGRDPPSNLSLAVLQIITNNFSDELIIGRGGCGLVYKGILANGIIAVKKLFHSHTIDDKMFHQEVQSMMMVNHQNTVRFLGYCSHTEEKAMKFEGTVIMAQIRERLLCFEYIGNGSLESHLSDELRGLEWHTRYQIIQRTCEGLQHLHKEKDIIHMDLKPANILIDDCMVPKITDFGLSRLDDKSQTMSAQRLLSLGYCAPEYLHHGKRSAKCDIYSLGVIILELVTGSKQIPCTTKVLRKWKRRWNKSTKDIQLGYKQVAKCLNLARRCTQTDPVDRPSIWDIISDLNKMDNSDVNISDATECLELEDMLGIEPLEIHLPFELNKHISCSVELTNDTDDYFAYRISTTSLRPYCINTNKDILPPRSKCSVTITLQALKKEPQHNQHRDEFSVQSTRVDGNLTPKDITGELFAEHSGKVVDDVNLVVVLDAPPPLPGDR